MSTAVVSAIAELAIVMFQLNARIAASALPYLTGDIAPFEWAGLSSPSGLGYGFHKKGV